MAVAVPRGSRHEPVAQGGTYLSLEPQVCQGKSLTVGTEALTLSVTWLVPSPFGPPYPFLPSNGD